jgi:hypothetical protein
MKMMDWFGETKPLSVSVIAVVLTKAGAKRHALLVKLIKSDWRCARSSGLAKRPSRWSTPRMNVCEVVAAVACFLLNNPAFGGLL